MNLEEIKSILQLMEANKLVEFEYEDDGRRLKLRRAEDRVVTTAVPMHVPTAVPMDAVASPAAPAAAPEARPANVTEFKSPLVGTFYRSAKPDSDPFVNVGDEVGPEKVLCIIEAMKVMNEIKAEVRGVVTQILVESAKPVEFGQAMFKIRPL